jgi:hypothetical protein
LRLQAKRQPVVTHRRCKTTSTVWRSRCSRGRRGWVGLPPAAPVRVLDQCLLGQQWLAGLGVRRACPDHSCRMRFRVQTVAGLPALLDQRAGSDTGPDRAEPIRQSAPIKGPAFRVCIARRALDPARWVRLRLVLRGGESICAHSGSFFKGGRGPGVSTPVSLPSLRVGLGRSVGVHRQQQWPGSIGRPLVRSVPDQSRSGGDD